jgi:UPF0716 protein FxsA
MRFLVLAILLAFPVADVWLTTRFAHWAGVPAWVFLVGSFLAGLLLLRNERIAFRARTVAALHGEQSLMRGLLDSGRKVLAGFLLMLPGLVSDAMALTLLLLPLNVGRAFGPQPVMAGRAPGARPYETLDGDFRRVD